MIFSKFLDSLVLSDVEGLLLRIKTMNLKRRVRKLKKILLRNLSTRYLTSTQTTILKISGLLSSIFTFSLSHSEISTKTPVYVNK
jgi:hypothetical protein